MTPAELKDVLHVRGIAARVKGSEVVVETCTFCGNSKGNLELSATLGVYHCWACGSGGHLDRYLRDLTGREYHIPVQRGAKKERTTSAPVDDDFKRADVGENPVVLAYLKRRGITVAVARQYGIGVCVEPGHLLEGRIVVPQREFWSQDVIGWVGRSVTGKKPKYLSTVEHRTVTGWRVPDRSAPFVVVEGSFDGIAVHRAGFHTAVLSGITGDVVPWASRVQYATPICVLLDGAAVEEAERLYWSIQPVHERVVRIPLPDGIDPGELVPDVIRVLVDRHVPEYQ